MFAYVDETGNTGSNVFDANQPWFMTAALLTKSNFDVVYGARVKTIARRFGKDALHANELGLERLDGIAADILKILKDADARFFLSRLEKRYLAATKVMDTLFDSGENLAVPWHVYNVKYLKLIMTFKLASFIVDEKLARLVWSCLHEKNRNKAYGLFDEACALILSRVSNVPDERSRTVIREATEWARANPYEIHITSDTKQMRHGHSPNLVAFSNLLDGIDAVSKSWGRTVKEIVHDEQEEFQRTIQTWHALFANASDETIHIFGNEPYSLQRAANSKIRIVRDEASPGIQMADVLLWLFKTVLADKPVGPKTAKLMRHIFKRAYQNDFSFDGVYQSLEEKMRPIMEADMPDEQLQKGHDFIAKVEEHRQANMMDYAAKRLASE